MRIDAALGKILRSFNLLELNVGLCLRYLASPGDPIALHSYLKRVGISEAVNRLKSLIDECDHLTDTRAFQSWMISIEEVRQLRNFYVHGTWECASCRDDAPLVFRMPPWRTEAIEGKQDRTMKIRDLEADADRIELVFIEFMRIRREYRI